MKYRARPDLAGAPAVATFDSPDKLRLAMAAHLKDHEARFDFLSRCRRTLSHARRGPDRRLGVPVPEVATIRYPSPVVRLPRQTAFGENLSFTPWHSLARASAAGRDQPDAQGGLPAISKQRHELNGVPRREPTA